MGKAITVASHYLIDQDSAHINNTIIDGSSPAVPEFASVVTFFSGEDTTSVLCGFTITGGTGLYLENYDAWSGGGIVCYYATAKIIHNKIINNILSGNNYAWGAGIASINETGGTWTVIEDNIIRNNLSEAEMVAATGGGIEVWDNARICGNLIEDNYCLCISGSGGGGGVAVSSEDITLAKLYFNRNIVRNNTIEADWVFGVGVYIYKMTLKEFTHNKINHNKVITNDDYWFGAGVYCEQLEGKATIRHNEFAYNSGPAEPVGAGGGICFFDSFDTEIIVDANQFLNDTAYHGGGIFERSTYNLHITNNLFVGNYAYRGGAIGMFHPLRKDESVSQDVLIPSIINNTFYGNTAINDAGAIRLQCDQQTPVIFNCIFWENEAQMGDDIYNWRLDEVIVSYSDIDADNIFGPWDGEGNINEDPIFLDPENDDFCIEPCSSPCDDAGIDSLFIEGFGLYMAPDHDILGNPRPLPVVNQPDMGAYEVDICEGISHFKFQVSNFNLQVAPNPSSGKSHIRYQITRPTTGGSDSRYVKLEVFDIHGQQVKILVHEKQAAGEYVVPFNGTGLAPGLYFLKLHFGDAIETVKVLSIPNK